MSVGPVGDTDYEWPAFPDGAATFTDGDGGWYHVCNSEISLAAAGDVSAVHYDAEGEILDAYPVLEGSIANCAGGPTPWGTWLSCEEDFGAEQGLVWECDPTGEAEAVAHQALGRWAHEAVAVDPADERLYLTQDHPTGLLYRFTPTAYPALDDGLLEAAVVVDDGTVTWAEVPDPSGASAPLGSRCRRRPRSTAVKACGTTTASWSSAPRATTPSGRSTSPARHSAKSTGPIPTRWRPERRCSPGRRHHRRRGRGDLFVAEDGGNMEVVTITPDGTVSPFARVPGQEGSEITGPVFNPSRDRLYFSSQRGPSTRPWPIVPGVDVQERIAGVTYEITGPFLGAAETAASTTTEAAESTSTTAGSPESGDTTTVPSPTTTLGNVDGSGSGDESDDDDGGDSGVLIGLGVGVAAVAVVAGG